MMNRFSRRSLIAATNLMGRAAVYLLLVSSLLSISGSFAQGTGAACVHGPTVHGVVNGADGRPVEDAIVHLQGSASQSAETRSDAHGAFTFSGVSFGSYQLRAERANVRGRMVGVTLSAADCNQTANLILQSGDDAVAKSAGEPLEQAMQFADQPNFTIAGVTDWTAAGGHGSDTVLRASESLASETRDLNAEDASLPDTGAAGNNVALTPRQAADLRRGDDRLHALLKGHPDAALLRRVAGLDEKLSDPLSAVREYEAAAKLDPSEESYFDWGSELLLHRAVWQAQEVLQKGVAAYPQSVRMHTALGSAFFAGARYEDAALQMCKASSLRPSDPEPYLFMGQIQIAAPESLHCIEPRLQAFAAMDPANATAHYLYAMAILKQQERSPDAQRVQQAEMQLTKAAALNPRFADAYLQLGIIAASRGSYKKAIELYAKAIETNPQLADAYYRLGVAYDRTAQPEKASQEMALHDRIKREQTEAVERQRRDLKQFVFSASGATSLTGAP